MKFLRAWVNGAVVPGVLDNNGVRRNISALAADVTSAQISGAVWPKLKVLTSRPCLRLRPMRHWWRLGRIARSLFVSV